MIHHRREGQVELCEVGEGGETDPLAPHDRPDSLAHGKGSLEVNENDEIPLLRTAHEKSEVSFSSKVERV